MASDQASDISRAESRSSRPAAVAAPIAPKIGGGYQPASAGSCSTAAAIRQVRSQATATAASSSSPDTPHGPSRASAAGTLAVFGWLGAGS